MKKIYVLLFITFLFQQNKAQHTLTAAFNPVVGDIEAYDALDTTGLFLGSSGTSQTWNYTGVVLQGSPTSMTYVPMSSVPNSSLFPSGNIASDDGAGNFNVYDNTSSKFELLGSAAAIASNCAVYGDPIRFYSLPFMYGSSSADTFSSATTGYTITGTFTATGDGTGTLQLPSGTYSNILKITFSVYEIANFGTSVDTYTIIEDRYYSSLSKFPLLTVGSQTISSFGVYKYGQINTFFSTSVKESLFDKSISVFPDPVTGGELFVKSGGTKQITSMEIINSIGQKIMSISPDEIKGIETTRIDVSKLGKGIYYLVIGTSDGTRSKKIIIE